MLYINDELIAMVKRFNQYRGGPDQEFWLSQWNNSPVKITRKTQDTIYFEKPSISIIGGIQPAVINELAKGDRLENGFIYRFLFVLPEDNKPDYWSEKEIGIERIQQYDNFIESINQIFENAYLDGDPIEVEFSPSAKEIFITWKNRNVDLIHESKDDSIKSTYSKL